MKLQTPTVVRFTLGQGSLYHNNFVLLCSVSECNLTVSSNIAKTASAVDADQSVFSTVAVPLPLSCPFQHLHAWQPYHHDDEGQGQGLSEFKQGQFHVIMMEGVVYRSVLITSFRSWT